jgi:predicted nucleic acid-binding protein
MELLFLDSSFVIALVFKADENYIRAQAIWEHVTGQHRQFLTTTFILDEVVTFLNGRGEHALAVEIGNLLLTSPAIEMVDVPRPRVEAGWQFFVRHDDKTYSLTDCIFFVAMNQASIAEALTFDSHFSQAGFQLVGSNRP